MRKTTRVSWVLSSMVAVVLAAGAIAFADTVFLDSDEAVPGNQNLVELTVPAGSAVGTGGTIAVRYGGTRHLAPGTSVLFEERIESDLEPGYTLPPAGYTMSSLALAIPDGWGTTVNRVEGAATVAFTAPATPGLYQYAVKWAPTSYSCVQAGCLAGGAHLKIHLEVIEPPCDPSTRYDVAFLPPVNGSTAGNAVVNTMRNGRVVPVKVTIYDNCEDRWVTDLTGESVTIGVARVTNVATGETDGVEQYADAGAANANTNEFRWAGEFWIYNLDSASLNLTLNETYRADVYVNAARATQQTWALLRPVR